jgi:hypothetical protein
MGFMYLLHHAYVVYIEPLVLQGVGEICQKFHLERGLHEGGEKGPVSFVCGDVNEEKVDKGKGVRIRQKRGVGG